MYTPVLSIYVGNRYSLFHWYRAMMNLAGFYAQQMGIKYIYTYFIKNRIYIHVCVATLDTGNSCQSLLRKTTPSSNSQNMWKCHWNILSVIWRLFPQRLCRLGLLFLNGIFVCLYFWFINLIFFVINLFLYSFNNQICSWFLSWKALFVFHFHNII